MQAEHNQEAHWTPTLKSRIDNCLQAEDLISQVQSGQTSLSLLLNFHATTHLLAGYFELDIKAPIADLRHTIGLCVQDKIQATMN